MNVVKILIVEDELLVAHALKSMLEKMGYCITAIYTTGKEVLENFVPGFADIVMMDIHLKGKLNGVETAMGIREISTAPIIYLTDNIDEGLRKKAIFETNTVQYLAKPFTQMDITIAIDLAIKSLRQQEFQARHTNSSSFLVNDCIFVKDGQGFKKLKVSEILLLHADGSYCKLRYKNNLGQVQEMLFSENLSFLEEKLKFCDHLYRVHRSFVINTRFITKIQEARIWLEDIEVPIGKTYRSDIKSRFRFI